MSYLENQQRTYQDILSKIDKKISKGKGIKSIRKYIVKQINKLEYLRSYE